MKRDMTLKRKWLAAMLVAAALSFSVGQQAMAQTKQAVVVGSSGNVTAVANGTCTVTVKSSDGKYSDTCNITVEIEESTEETKEEAKDETKDESADGSKDESADGSKDDSGSDKSSGARTRSRIRK